MPPELTRLKKADQPADTSSEMQLLSRNRPETAVNMRRLAFPTHTDTLAAYLASA